jgi:O-antigen/teichoic acid export membrane protein
VRNSTWSFAAQAFGYAINGAVAIYAVRSFEVETWGHYATAIALISILTVFSELGLASLTLREMSDHPGDIRAALARGSRAVLVTAAACLAALPLLALLLGYHGETGRLLIVAAPMILLQPLLAMLRSTFNARRVLGPAAVFNMVNAAAFGLSAVVLITAGAHAYGLVGAIVIGYLAGAIVGYFLIRKHLHFRPTFRGGGKVGPFLRAAIPIAVVGGMAVVYDRVDVLMLSKLTSATETAYYSVPYTMVKLTWAVPSVIALAFFPLFTQLRREDPAEGERTFLLVMRIFFFLAVPAAVGIAFSGADVIPFAFGSRYDESVPVLAILAWTIVFSFQNYILWYGILATHRERAVLPIQATGLALNIALNFALIPLWGASGAAVALLISDAWTVAGQAWLVHRHLYRLDVVHLLGQPLAALAVVTPLALLLHQVSPLLAGIAGAFACVALLLVRYVPPAEWTPVTGPAKDILRRARARLRPAGA